ncbi:hypothetical protein B9G39_15410 [Zooshikella ganghwensis]|uniref:Uncharacterized protein n=1 Tax=Zooshikella ganghwensis TaxID=202772 RepID=A0A4P9VMR6_9GAMM|nr:hypothetical protein B9G39_15410 [Zooshikella ganghwensis]
MIKNSFQGQVASKNENTLFRDSRVKSCSRMHMYSLYTVIPCAVLIYSYKKARFLKMLIRLY